ncbi:MAG: aryl-sulfate sulfotransferase [Synergistaceae bacterium]|nr:aryl-sulfate sulfotransferase [Synergistaceae bacterium]
MVASETFHNEKNVIDQITERRKSIGIIAYAPSKSEGGYTLFAPLTGGGAVYLIDERGNIAHRWRRNVRPGRHAVLLQNGNLGYDGVDPDAEILYPFWHVWHGGLFQEVTPDDKVVWEYRDPGHHHDAVWLPDGHLIYATAEKLPEETAECLREKLGTLGEGMPLVGDVVKEVDREGQLVWVWRSWEHIDPAIFPFEPIMPRYHWPYVNGLAKTHTGLVLMSLRVTSGIIAVNPKSGEIVWRVGRDIAAQQHAPAELGNGNILAFDNGNYRPGNSTPFSRVVEFSPSGKVIWEYRDQVAPSFFTPYMGNAQRLPGGNTLVNEAAFGRLFEVTPEGETVWEYVIPFFDRYPADVERVYGEKGYHNSVFKAFRYQKHEIPWMR